MLGHSRKLTRRTLHLGMIQGLLRPVFNYMVCPQGLKFASYLEFSPLRSPPGVNTLYCLEESRGDQRISPPEDNFSPRVQSLPLGAKLRMGLSTPEIMSLWVPWWRRLVVTSPLADILHIYGP
jgi:hypothetical protein